MSLSTADAEKILHEWLGNAVKTPTNYVIGFTMPSGKVLALDRRAAKTRVWLQPPAPPEIAGAHLMESPSNGNSNLNGPLSPLREPTTIRLQIDSQGALERLLDWLLQRDRDALHGQSDPVSGPPNFTASFERFQDLVELKSGYRFSDFDEGLAAVWEGYKPRLRDHAVNLLSPEKWTESEIGSGKILNRAIQAIEIQESQLNLTNNLVFWQNRYGHANREHRVLLDAKSEVDRLHPIERLLFDLYRDKAEEAVIFERLTELSGGKYPLLAYLFFLKDMDRFMPIQPTGFDRAFKALGIDIRTLRQCSWENYSKYNETLDRLRPHIKDAAGLTTVRLVDAHSFCWIYSTLLKQDINGTLERTVGSEDAGRILGERERSIIDMRNSVEATVRNSDGQLVERTIKNKELRMTQLELEKHIRGLLDLQDNKCALTGLTLHFSRPNADRNLLPSLDRIDSNGHYDIGNLQVVCRFINFWKADGDDDEFRRLLMLVREVGNGQDDLHHR